VHDRRLRLALTALLGTITAILSITPLAVWHHAHDDAIRSRIRTEAIAQMEEVLRGEITGQRNDDYYSWYANVNDGYEEPFVESDLLPPVRNWIRDAGGYSSFREYPVEGEDGYLAFVRPLDENAGYVTLVSVTEQRHDLSSSSRRFWIITVLLLLASYGLAFFVGGLALGPTKRLLGDQQGFLADAAHEMRTPLAVILASSSQALARPRTSEEYVRSLAEIRSAAERAGSGINEMLDLVRLNTGQAIPRLAPLRLDLLAEEVAASIRPEGAEVVAEPSDPVVVDADMALLRQAIDNLVRNAALRSLSAR
jgi:signal transduction histidine kinase